MIDIENMVFDRIAKRVHRDLPDIYITGEYVSSPPSLPAVYVIQADSSSYESTGDSGSNENHAVVMFEVSTYSNKTVGKKSETKYIMSLIDEEMIAMGFQRMTLTTVPNERDATIYRMVGRYRAVVSADHKLYRR